jgi:hypothetical protein
MLLYRVTALIAAAQARIAGMQVENASIDLQAYPPKYDAAAFFAEAQYLENLAVDARNAS